jgi:hypothetical protein
MAIFLDEAQVTELLDMGSCRGGASRSGARAS